MSEISNLNFENNGVNGTRPLGEGSSPGSSEDFLPNFEFTSKAFNHILIKLLYYIKFFYIHIYLGFMFVTFVFSFVYTLL